MSSSHSESPPGQSLVVSITVLAIIGLGVLCSTLEVIPDERFRGPSGYLSGLGLAALYASIQFLVVARVRRWEPLAFPHAWVGLFLIATLLYSLFFWPVVRLGLPWVAAAVAGEPVTERFEMRTDPQPRRTKSLSCRYGLRGGPLPEPVAPGYRLCITTEQWRQFPDTPVAVTITGDRTAWGMRVKEIVAIEEIGPR